MTKDDQRKARGALRIIFSFNPTGADRISHKVAAYLDGREDTLPPFIQSKIDGAIADLNSVELEVMSEEN